MSPIAMPAAVAEAPLDRHLPASGSRRRPRTGRRRPARWAPAGRATSPVNSRAALAPSPPSRSRRGCRFPATPTTRARSTGMSEARPEPARSRNALTPAAWSGWTSIRNMSGAVRRRRDRELASRFACSDRTPTMKNAPRPTASRTALVWLPGPRSGGARRAAARTDRDAASGGRPPPSPTPGQVQRERRPPKPTDTTGRLGARPACQRRSAPARRAASHRGPADPVATRPPSPATPAAGATA